MKNSTLITIVLLFQLVINSCEKGNDLNNDYDFFIKMGKLNSYNYNQNSLLITKDNQIMVFYHSYVAAASKCITFLKKCDLDGQQIWGKKYEFSSHTYAGGIIQTLEGGFLLTGEFNYGNTWVETYAFLIKTDQNGDSLWSKNYSDGYNDKEIKLQQINNEEYMFFTYTDLNKNMVLILNSAGDTILKKYIERGKCDPSCSGYYDFQTDNNGNYFFVGEYIAKFSNSLEPNWSKKMNGKGKSIVVDNENNCVIFGQTGQYGSFDYYLYKIDNNGNLLWEKSYDYEKNDFAEHIENTSDGGFVLIGTSESVTSDLETSNVIKVIKVDKDGNVMWDKEYNFGSMNMNRGISIKQLDSNQYVVLGISDLSATEFISDLSTVLFKVTIK